MNENKIIETENIAKIIDNTLIFDKISFTVWENEFVCLKGPSGCGKTTLLRILSGLIAPTSGKIYLFNKLANSPNVLMPPHKRQISLLFQDLALWPHMSGLEQLKFVWESNKYKSFSQALAELCWEIGFPQKLLSKYPAHLSRGENQRLAIVRSLISHPKILLLDEPMTALDQKLRSRLIKFLKKLKKEKSTTVILVSHDLMTDMLEYDQDFVFKNGSFLKIK